MVGWQVLNQVIRTASGYQGKNSGQNKEVDAASGSQRGSNETGNQGKKKGKNKKPKTKWMMPFKIQK